MVLKPQDVLVLLKLWVLGENPWTYNVLAVEVGMSPAEVHAAVRRLLAAQLLLRKDGRVVPNGQNMAEFLIHGVRYAFPPERGELTRGMPTAVAAPPLDKAFAASSEPAPVWPDPEGTVRGAAFSPLYKAVPKAAGRDPNLYELLALLDAIRGGRARERNLAVEHLRKRLGSNASERESES